MPHNLQPNDFASSAAAGNPGLFSSPSEVLPPSSASSKVSAFKRFVTKKIIKQINNIEVAGDVSGISVVDDGPAQQQQQQQTPGKLRIISQGSMNVSQSNIQQQQRPGVGKRILEGPYLWY